MVAHPEDDGAIVDEARREQVTDLLAALAVREEALAAAELRWAGAQERVRDVDATVAAAEAARLAAEARFEAAVQQTQALRATLSWRVTVPLRAVRRLTRAGRG